MPRPEDADHDRLNLEWLVVQAIREGAMIALRGQTLVTYAHALAIGREVAPAIFDPDVSLLSRGQEPPGVREYRQLAEAETQLKNKHVSALELVERDLDYARKLAHSTKGARDKIMAKVRRLEAIRDQLTDRSHTEQDLLIRDTFQAVRLGLPTPVARPNKTVEYRLSPDRGLRMRLLHPDPGERLTGADLVYELYSNGNQTARVALVQYKRWDGQSLYLRDSRVKRQLELLRDKSCGRNFCDGPAEGTRAQQFRLPYCAAFVRPTDELQEPDARLVTSGLHVPRCVVDSAKRQTDAGHDVLRRDDLFSRAMSPEVFEWLFNHEMLGTRPLSFDELDAFYREHKVFGPGESLKVHVQNFDVDE